MGKRLFTEAYEVNHFNFLWSAKNLILAWLLDVDILGMLLFYILIFLICCVLFYFSGKWTVDGLVHISKFLGLREFVVAFFVIAVAASLPNLFVGISSALRKIPQLSFGDIAGNNLAALTLVVAAAALFAKGGIPAESRTVQKTSLFTIAAAILPIILILDGLLSRTDGIVLIGLFIFYITWLFSKKERFTKIYDHSKEKQPDRFRTFLKDAAKVVLGLLIMILASQGIVLSAQFFAQNFNLSLLLIGILVTGLGSTLPEFYFDIVSARKGEGWMILGDLMGAIIIPSTLILGIVALICPIQLFDSSPLVIARFFLIVSALFFLIFVRSNQRISKKEALVLLLIYIAFLITEIFFNKIFG